MPRFSRHIAAAATLLFLAGCGAETDGDDGNGSAAADPTNEAAATELEGVEHFYGEYGDYVSVMAAIQAGEVTAEELEHPFVVQQDHVDAQDPTAVPEYELSPPVGGDHLSVWQTCTGSVYPDPIADGNGVHSMEHGAVWLTYDPALVDGDGIGLLRSKIEGRDYSLMSPYPEQGVAVSLQSWGNRYQTEDLDDPMIEAYLDTYILNERFNPETMATCSDGISTTIAR